MDVRLLPVLLLFCSTEASWDDVSEKILASVGAAVVLPCNISATDDLPTLEWSKQRLDPEIVLLYRGCETHEEKNPAFEHRTSLFMKELRHGNISLRISNVELSDAGKYKCKTIRNMVQNSIVIELFVGAVSEPKLSEVPAVDGGVTLQCDANCWFPKPEIAFFDIHGNRMFAETPKISVDSRGCFTVTRRMTVEHFNRVICRVHQPDINETRTTEIYRSGVCQMCTTLIITIVVSVLLNVCGFSICVVCLCKKYGNCEVFRNSSDRTTIKKAKLDQADSTSHAQLLENLRMKDEVICKLTKEVKDLQLKQAHVVCQHGQPTIDCSPSKSSPDFLKPINLPHDNDPKPAASRKSNRPKKGNLPENKDSKLTVSRQTSASVPVITAPDHGTPAPSTDSGAVSPDSASAATSDQSPIIRTKSLSGPHQRSAKPQRRYSTCLSGNPFIVLNNLTEEMEQLL
ncbi:butyrophilin-like protein 1 isoform X2 [Pempheris klunzingeri]|uniref:butyrophilin-like protein 1 isoform X2 n=1 Tax=Pempheris klunzingeri TaxID=3127111 RepID=UPI0039816A92